MKSLSKVITITLLLFAVTIITSGFTFGQSGVKNIGYKFTGEKARIIIESANPADLILTKDWIGRSFTIDLPGGSSGLKNFSSKNWNNYIVRGGELTGNKNGTRLKVNTRTDFLIKKLEMQNGTAIFDIYPLLETPGAGVLLKRASYYEGRNNFKNAAEMYKAALKQDIINDKIKFLLGFVLFKDENNRESEFVLKTISDKSPYFEKSRTLIRSMNLNKPTPAEPQNDDSGTGAENGDAETDDSKDNNSPEEGEKESEDKSKQGTSPAEESGIVKNGTISAENQKPGDKFMGLQKLLKMSGTENSLFYILYAVTGFLALIVVILLFRVIYTYNRANKRKRLRRSQAVKKSRKMIKHNKKAIVTSPGQMNEIRMFASKLSDLYAKTETGMPKKRPVVKTISAEPEEEHTKLIEKVLNENDFQPVDSESINLIKKFRDNNGAKSSKDKYDAVMCLAEKNWEIWEIARELSMGTEEIKMLLSKEVKYEFEDTGKNLEARIFKLHEMNISAAEIAKKLRIGEEEVCLALKLREQMHFTADEFA